MKKLEIHNMRFVTEDKKQVLLQGINIVCKEKEKGYLYPNMEELFRIFQMRGFNLIRFGIFWDGVEPQPGKYDTEYLGKVKDTIRLAEKYGIYVILDMHQDLFAQKYGDGAPDWATLDEGAYHPENCTNWYDAYINSDAIIQAADSFWANAKAPDGIGLLEHYENMWGMLAQLLDDCNNIIGYEPMNEPFMGSVARNVFEDVTMITGNEFLEFDRDTLMPFYRRIQNAIRKYSTKPLVTGGNIYCSSTFRTGISRIDPDSDNQIYAPHGYDAVVDSDRYESFNKQNVELLFADKYNSQQEMNLPVVVGEWGAFPSKEFTNDLIRHMNGILEKYLWSSAYWVYYPGMEYDAHYSSLYRAYPVEIAGILESYSYDENAKTIQVVYMADKGGESKIYCPYLPLHVKADTLIDYEVEKIADSSCFVRVMCKTGGKTVLTI